MTPAAGPLAPPTRRQRLREQTLGEIKQVALRQMAEHGAGSLTLTAVAKELGMAGPSLYRYYPSRDALLTELIVEAFRDLATTVAAAAGPLPPRTGEPGADPAGAVAALRRYVQAYRGWATANPELYELLFGTPVPGYHAPMDVTGPAAVESMLTAVTLLASVGGGAGPRTGPSVRPSPRWSGIQRRTGVDVATFARAVTLWAHFHGLLVLELRGDLPQMLEDPGALFAAELERVLADLAR